jgi:hypothetical protein
MKHEHIYMSPRPEFRGGYSIPLTSDREFPATGYALHNDIGLFDSTLQELSLGPFNKRRDQRSIPSRVDNGDSEC